MEFVVITGGTVEQAEQYGNSLRAHGYHYLSPALYFIDDFGDAHPNPGLDTAAQQWFQKRLNSEITHHHDLVIHSIYFSPELKQKAEDEGFHIDVIELDKNNDDVLNSEVKHLIEVHDREHPSIWHRLAKALTRQDS